jgi:catecholate siderophore receptor
MTRKAARKKKLKRHAARPCAPLAPRARSSWIVMSALVASTAFGGRDAGARELAAVLRASDDRRAQISTGAPRAYASSTAMPDAGDEPVRRFDIAGGALDVVLAAFTQATGIAVHLPNVDGVGAIYSPGLAGTFTIEQALHALLTGTSLSVRMTAPDSARLDFRTQTESVDVIARAPISVSPKYAAPLVDTPQSIDVIPARILAEQGVTTLRDAVRNVAGISLAAGEGGSQGDNLTIRGFTARNDMFIDGMRDFGSYYRDPFNQEEVQVLKGPSSVMFGRGSTGGVVNQASKAPHLTPALGGTVSLGTDQTRRVTVDIDQPVPALGTGAAVRLNVMGHDAQVAGRDIAENRRFGVAPSLALGLGTPTRVTVSYFHQSGNDTPDYGIPWLFAGPAPVDRANYYGFEAANVLRTSADIANARVEHDFSGALSVTNQVRYASYARDAQITEAKVAPTVTPATPLDDIVVTRHQIAVSSVESFLQNQLDATARIQTGAVQHTLVAGIELGRETSDPTRPAFTGVPGTSLLHPDEHQPFSGSSTIASRVRTTALSAGVYALDTVSLGSRLDLIGGARWDRFDASYAQSVAPTSAFRRVDTMPSWRGAIVYKPRASASIYAGYGTSFNPSAESLSLSASTADTPPESNTTSEVGAKWELPHRLSMRAATFRTNKSNAREPDPNNPLQNVLSGEQRVNGIEVEVNGHITDRWQVVSSYAFMDATLVKSAAYPAAAGAQLANVPRHSFNAWSTFDLPWRLQIGGGARYVGRRTASTTTPLDPSTGLVKALPGYWTSSAMAKRPLTARLDLQLNVDNLADAYYFDQLHPGHIVPGPGRSALLGLAFKF